MYSYILNKNVLYFKLNTYVCYLEIEFKLV